jgi:hypothetical protein
MHRLIAHFQRIAPAWLLIGCDWPATKQAAEHLAHCSDIVVLARLKWFDGSKHTGKDSLVQIRCPAWQWSCAPLARPEQDDRCTAPQGVRAMLQVLRAGAN